MRAAILAWYVLAACTAVTFGVLVAHAEWSRPIGCSEQPHHVYLVDERACVPLNAILPAREATP